MKIILKSFFIYLFIAVQSLIPVSSEISLVSKMTNSDAIAGEMSTLDLTKGSDENDYQFDNQSGEEGFFKGFGGAFFRFINNLIIWIIGLWTATVSGRCWIQGVGCGWSTYFAMIGFGAFLISEIGAIWSHQSTLDQMVYDLDRMKTCAKYLFKKSNDPESESCQDARDQYGAFQKQVDAYDSVGTGLWIKYLALIVLDAALLTAAIMENVAWATEEGTDVSLLSSGAADIAMCISSAGTRPECSAATACSTALEKYNTAVGKLQALRSSQTATLVQVANSLKVEGFTDSFTATASSSGGVNYCQTSLNYFTAAYDALKAGCLPAMSAGCCAISSMALAQKRLQEHACANTSNGTFPCNATCPEPGTSTEGKIIDKTTNKHYVDNSKSHVDEQELLNELNRLVSKVIDLIIVGKAQANDCNEEDEDGDKKSCVNRGRSDGADIASVMNHFAAMIGSGLPLLLMYKLDPTLDKFYNTPGTRSLLHYVSASLVGWQILDTHYAIDQVEEKVKMIKGVMAKFKGFTGSQAQFNVQQNNLVSADFDTLEKDMSDFPTGGIPFGGGEKIPCIMRGQLGDGVSGCVSSRGFNQTALGNLNLDSLNQLGSDLTDLGDSIGGAEGLSKENFVKLTKVAQNAKRSKGLLNALKKKSFEDLQEFGGPSLEEFEQKARSIAKGIQNSAVAAIKSKGIDLKQFNEKVKENRSKEKISENLKKAGTIVKAPQEKGTQGFDFNFEEEESNDFDLDTAGNRAISDLDVAVDDVRETKSEDIFKVLTIRYFKSAYPVLLEEQK